MPERTWVGTTCPDCKRFIEIPNPDLDKAQAERDKLRADLAAANKTIRKLADAGEVLADWLERQVPYDEGTEYDIAKHRDLATDALTEIDRRG